MSSPRDVSHAELMALSETVGINGLAVSGFQKMVDSGFDLISATAGDKQQWRAMYRPGHEDGAEIDFAVAGRAEVG